MPSTMARNHLEEAHEAQVSANGEKEVKYAFAFKKLDWDAYHFYRPKYPESMWKMWIDYQQQHAGKFEKAHDIGTGPGTAATVLARYFDRVVVSDAGENNLLSAQHYLTSASSTPSSPDKFSFHVAPAEQAHTHQPPASADFVSIAMAFHYMDAPAAIKSIATTLRPGGTLAAVTYGFRLLFPGHPRAEECYYAAASKESLRLIRTGKLFPAAVRGLARAMTGLDFVPLPTELFEPGAKRIYVNVDEREKRPFYFVDKDDSYQEAESVVADVDVKEFVRDENWRREADAAWLRGFLVSCQMGFDEQTWATEEWTELEQIVADAGGTITVEWPVAMLLATRRRDV